MDIVCDSIQCLCEHALQCHVEAGIGRAPQRHRENLPGGGLYPCVVGHGRAGQG